MEIDDEDRGEGSIVEGGTAEGATADSNKPWWVNADHVHSLLAHEEDEDEDEGGEWMVMPGAEGGQQHHQNNQQKRLDEYPTPSFPHQRRSGRGGGGSGSSTTSDLRMYEDGDSISPTSSGGRKRRRRDLYYHHVDKSPCRQYFERFLGVVTPPLVLLAVWVAFSGWTFVAEMALDTGINPLALSLERELVAIPVMFWYAFWRDGEVVLIRRGHLPLLVLVGLLSACSTVAAIEALNYVSAGTAGMVTLVVPVLTTAFAWLFGLERVSRLKVVGIGAAVSGALLVQFFYSKDGGFAMIEGRSSSSLWWVGALLLALQVTAAAGLAVGLEELVVVYSPWAVTAWYYVISAMFTTAACAATQTSFMDLGLVVTKLKAMLALLYGAIVVSSFNWNAISWAVSMVSPSIVMSSVTIQPTATLVLALLLTGDKISWPEMVGSIVVGVGLILLWVGHSRERAQAEEERMEALAGERKPLLTGAGDAQETEGHWADHTFV